MKDNLYAIGYAGILGATCALLLTGAASLTAPYRARNEKIEEVLNILTALDVPIEDSDKAEALLEKYETNVREEQRGDIARYLYAPPGATNEPKAIAIRFAGPGLWGPMEGFLALEADMRTIRGLSFSKQEETPGLGGEIVAPWFREQFRGKSIVDADGNPGIRIGGDPGPNHVDAITGATMTCDKLEAILCDITERFIKEANGK